MSDSTKKKVAYCGIEGAFAHIAAKKLFPEDQLVLAKLFGRFSALAAEFVVCVTTAARLKFHPKISLAATADTAPRLALRKNSLNSPRSLGA